MPTVLLQAGFRFYFYSNEGNEPAHIHVSKGNGLGKIWLEPEMQVAYFNGFSPTEQKQILAITRDNVGSFKIKWNEFFGK